MSHWSVLYALLMAQPDLQCVSEKNIALLVLALHQGPERPQGRGDQARCFTPHPPVPALTSACFLIRAPSQYCIHPTTSCHLPRQALHKEGSSQPWTAPSLEQPTHTFVALGVRWAQQPHTALCHTWNRAEAVLKYDS